MRLLTIVNAQQPYNGTAVPADLNLGDLQDQEPLADRALMSYADVPSPYGPPFIHATGWLQWPDDCTSSSINVCYTKYMKPDIWLWALGGSCLTGIFVPKVYYDEKNLDDEFYDPLCVKRVLDLAGGASTLGVNHPRLGYNLKVFPGDPEVKGILTSKRPQKLTIGYTGEPFLANEPSYVVVG